MKANLFSILCLSPLPMPLHSAVPAFAPVFNRGAVLPCEMPAHIWGTATPDADMSVRLDGAQVATTKTARDGDPSALNR
jgi:hypothetical protein